MVTQAKDALGAERIGRGERGHTSHSRLPPMVGTSHIQTAVFLVVA